MKNISLIITFCLVLALNLSAKDSIYIVVEEGAESPILEAAKDLAESLPKLYPKLETFVVQEKSQSGRNIILCKKSSLIDRFPDCKTLEAKGGFMLRKISDSEFLVAGFDAKACATGAYQLLKKLGVSFNLNGDIALEKSEGFSFENLNFEGVPKFEDSQVLNWSNFLTSCSTWEIAKWKTYIKQLCKLGYGGITYHVYGADVFVDWAYKGRNKITQYLPASDRAAGWAVQNVADVRNMIGGELFKKYYFGVEHTRLDVSEQAKKSQQMLSEVFEYARYLGLEVNFSFDLDTPYAVQSHMVEFSTSPTAFLKNSAKQNIYPNVDDADGYAFIKAMLKNILDKYPQVTKLTICSRKMGNNPQANILLQSIDKASLPKHWQAEFEASLAELKKEPDLYIKPENCLGFFILGKTAQAVVRAAKELGRGDIKWQHTSWGFEYILPADFFMPKCFTFAPMDWNMSEFEMGKDFKTTLAITAKGRKVSPYFWPHHDDYALLIRPSTPSQELMNKLEKSGASGFNVLHWYTHPHDIWFQFYAAKIWTHSEKTTLDECIEKFSKDNFGESAKSAMSAYFKDWISTAPRFGRETKDFFMYELPMKVGGRVFELDTQEVSAGVERRKAILRSVPVAKLDDFAKSQLEYFYNLEDFADKFVRSFKAYEAISKAMKKSYADASKLPHSEPQIPVEAFAKALHYYADEGALGTLISLNTRWLPHVYAQEYALGWRIFRVNFAETHHARSAMGLGKFSYAYDSQKRLWWTLGNDEMNFNIAALKPEIKILASLSPQDTAVSELCFTGALLAAKKDFSEAQTNNFLQDPIAKDSNLEAVAEFSLYPISVEKFIAGKYKCKLFVQNLSSSQTALVKIYQSDNLLLAKTLGANNKLGESLLEALEFELNLSDDSRLEFRIETVSGAILMNAFTAEKY